MAKRDIHFFMDKNTCMMALGMLRIEEPAIFGDIMHRSDSFVIACDASQFDEIEAKIREKCFHAYYSLAGLGVSIDKNQSAYVTVIGYGQGDECCPTTVVEVGLERQMSNSSLVLPSYGRA